jgi:Transposase DDE domain
MTPSLRRQRRQALQRWTALLRQHFSTLSGTQVTGLALWSIGIVLAESASLHAVVLALVCWLTFHSGNLHKRLQEWYLEAAAKKGHGTAGKGCHRRDFSPEQAAADLFQWILEDWPGHQLVLALDPTSFGDRFTVLNISVLYRGCAVPVIWTVVPGNEPGAWEPHWERMLQRLHTRVPPGWQILVLTDRGMYSPRLYQCLVALHWHPFLRIRAQGFYRLRPSREWLEIKDLRPSSGETQAFPAEVFKNEEGRLTCTLVAFQGAGHAEPWLIVTDLSAETARASWYGLRAWIEQGYKRTKSEGWGLQRTRIADCQRLERLWLAVAVATLWVLEVGGEAEVAEQRARPKKAPRKTVGVDRPALPDLTTSAASGEEPVPEEAPPPERPAAKRIWSVFSRGWQLARNGLAVGLVVLGSWHPEAWPDHPSRGLPATPAATPNTPPGEAEPSTTRGATAGNHGWNSS